MALFSLDRLKLLPLLLILVYPTLLGLLTLPSLQRELIFLHRIRIPFFTKYDQPEIYGLAPYKTRNFQLETPDGERLGVWHVLPRSEYKDLPLKLWGPINDVIFESSFRSRPTIIYFHGNAGNRAASHRVRNYMAFSSILNVNVVTFDYRGFGDSTGVPSEDGLLIDARTIYDYISDSIIRQNQHLGPIDAAGEIILVGQSLGTGVVSSLAGSLAKEGIYPRALVLIAPFSSIDTLLLDYKLFSIIPLLSPLKALPTIQQWLLSHVETKFNSAQSLNYTKSPTLILHAIDDDIIPHHHSKTLYNHLHTVHSSLTGTTAPRVEEDHPGWGRSSHFTRHPSDGGKVYWWEGLTGGHNHIGWSEGTIDLIEQVAQLGDWDPAQSAT